MMGTRRLYITLHTGLTQCDKVILFVVTKKKQTTGRTDHKIRGFFSHFHYNLVCILGSGKRCLCALYTKVTIQCCNYSTQRRIRTHFKSFHYRLVTLCQTSVSMKITLLGPYSWSAYLLFL
jgi:hypothetical protein